MSINVFSSQGFVTSEMFVEILRDLNEFVTKQSIKLPIILFIDGASPHISLTIGKFCQENLSQPWLLKPNSTHICQPLYLTFFSSLKSGFF